MYLVFNSLFFYRSPCYFESFYLDIRVSFLRFFNTFLMLRHVDGSSPSIREAGGPATMRGGQLTTQDHELLLISPVVDDQSIYYGSAGSFNQAELMINLDPLIGLN